jgi:hypothetical protein
MTSKLLNAVLAAALGAGVSGFSYAADTPQPLQPARSAALSEAEASAMKECRKLTATEQARCIVNVRPTSAGDKVGMASQGTTAKDGTDGTDADYAAALKECEAANVADKDRCINAAKERFGRM